MRKILLSFLMLLMLTPSLACAMPTCAETKAAANQPCADHHPDNKKTKSPGQVNLLLDCMGVDLQKADVTTLDKPDLKTDFVVYALVNDALTNQFVFTSANTIRGPPPDWPALSQTQPPILLTTQRFLI